MTDLPLLKRYRFWAGSIAALASAITFALNVVFSRVAYDYGANLHALNLVRTVTFLCCLAAVVFMTGSRVKMPTTEMLRCLFLGVLLCAEMYLLLASILFIPVALAILVFYAYPLMIALWACGTRKSRFSVMMFAAMVLAFCGLVIALTGDDLLSVGWQGRVGIGLAAFAAVCLATLLVLSEKVLEKQNINVMMFYMLLSATGTVLVISVAVFELHWPESSKGWLALTGSAGFYVAATFLLFRAVDLVGSLQTAIIDNTSPIWAMILGFIVLGQWLNVRQVTGAVITVVAVMLLQWLRRPKPV
ncbi:MAG: DMT family transporter [Acidiferrobacteraceae bacterium]|nr:DMT family transporter [Acidiferrobacteraceae bacterium]MBT3638992.1 DMT family transporter [Acidiferrobacteraceae bacterium]MBT3771166.1 DMT family transporter [Acidiferrobacteraceae bacterium]MBT3973030.1 DMT family transporter [Acidiferrobacteraceae bacterium]MBT4395390.1 DMT family transporter [Acidiferrobacteraceae bacterium]